MTEDIDDIPRFPVPGGQVDLVPIPATFTTDEGTAVTAREPLSWGYCPIGVFVTQGDPQFDGIIPFRKLAFITFHVEEEGRTNEGSSD